MANAKTNKIQNLKQEALGLLNKLYAESPDGVEAWRKELRQEIVCYVSDRWGDWFEYDEMGGPEDVRPDMDKAVALLSAFNRAEVKEVVDRDYPELLDRITDDLQTTHFYSMSVDEAFVLIQDHETIRRRLAEGGDEARQELDDDDVIAYIYYLVSNLAYIARTKELGIQPRPEYEPLVELVRRWYITYNKPFVTHPNFIIPMILLLRPDLGPEWDDLVDFLGALLGACERYYKSGE